MSAEATSIQPVLRRELRGKTLAIVRISATSFALLALVAYLRWLPRWFDLRLGTAAASTAGATQDLPFIPATWLSIVVAILAAAVWCGVALLVEIRRSRDLFGNILFVGFVSVGLVAATDVSVILPMQRADSLPQFQMPLLFAANALAIPWAFVFPDGRVVPRWAWLPASVWVGWSVLRVVTPAVDQANVGTPAILLNFGLIVSMPAAQVFRYFRRSNLVQKQQLKWILVGALVFILAYAATIPILELFPDIEKPGSGYLYRTFVSTFLSLSLISVPLALAAAIFRQGLLDIELILNRTIAYTAITVILVASFVLVSTLVNRLIETTTGARSDLVPVGTAIGLAGLFLPLRGAALRFADRFMNGRRVLTVLFVDISGSTEFAVRIGDRAWRQTLERFRVLVRREIQRYGGEEIDTAGDGFFVTFDGPGRAIRCAYSIVSVVDVLGLQAHAGLHIGEVEVYGGGISGVAVHIGARLMGLANPGEVLVSGALREVVSGSNIKLVDRGERPLRGVPGMTNVYAVASA